MKLFSKIGIFSLSLFVTSTAIYLWSPVIKTNAAETATPDVNINIGQVASLTIDKTVLDLSAIPNSFVSGIITATVSTNSQYGYTLAFEDADNSSSMTHTDSSIASAVTSTFAGSKTSSDMEANTWGFSIDATDFYKIPVYGSPVALKRTTTEMATSSEDTDVTFGVKVGPNLVSGTYTDHVLFTVYVNGQDGKPTNPDDPSNPPDDPSDIGAEDAPEFDDNGKCITTKTMYDITYMQEMTTCVCENTTRPANDARAITWTHTTDTSKIPKTVLIDKRDGKRYLISRLGDGGCWMSQDLALDLIANETVLTKADTDLNSKDVYIPQYSTLDHIVRSQYQDPDGYVGEYDRTDRSWYPDVTQSGRSGKLYLKKGITPSTTPTGPDDIYLYEKIGNYYTYGAATALSNRTDEYPNNYGNAIDSICPKGWRLAGSSIRSNGKNIEPQRQTQGWMENMNVKGTGVPTGTIFNLAMSGTIYRGEVNNLGESVVYMGAYTINDIGTTSTFYGDNVHATVFWTHTSEAIGMGYVVRCAAHQLLH